MSRRTLPLALVALFLLGEKCWAQDQGIVVQLPTVSMFGVFTTVSVPDSGRGLIGGVRRSSNGSTAFGPNVFGPQRAFGRDHRAAGVHVTATIHELDEMDKALLAEGQGGKAGSSKRRVLSSTDRSRLKLARAGRSSAGRPSGSVAEARRKRDEELQAKEQEALDFFAQAEDALADGKRSLAKSYFQMVARRANGELKEAALARLDDLAASAKKPRPSSRVQPTYDTPTEVAEETAVR